MSEKKAKKPSEKVESKNVSTTRREVTGYEVIMAKTIENILSTMQMYTVELHQKLVIRAMQALECTTALRLNPLQITDEEEKKGIKLLASDPRLATQAALNYGFNFTRHTSCDLGWNIALGVVLISLIERNG